MRWRSEVSTPLVPRWVVLRAKGGLDEGHRDGGSQGYPPINSNRLVALQGDGAAAAVAIVAAWFVNSRQAPRRIWSGFLTGHSTR